MTTTTATTATATEDAVSLEQFQQWRGTGQIAKTLGCSREYVAKLRRTGQLRGIKTTLGWLLDPQSVSAFEVRRHARKEMEPEV